MTDLVRRESGGNATLGDALDVRRACLVVIHDVWGGYNPHSPVAAVYVMRRETRGGLSGEGRLSTALAGERVVDIKVPSAAATRFLTAVASARLVPWPVLGDAGPHGRLPAIEIALHVDVRGIGEGNGLVLLYTESQGEFRPPGAHASVARCFPSLAKRSGRRWHRSGRRSNEEPSTG